MLINSSIHYLNFNHNRRSSSASSLGSILSDRSKNTFQSSTVGYSNERTGSLSSLSTTSITVILHRPNRRKKFSRRRQDQNSTSSSSMSLTRAFNQQNSSQTKPNKMKVNHHQRLSLLRPNPKPANLNHNTPLICHQSTQTDPHPFFHDQHRYGNLRRVNSDLLDYIFIPIGNF